MKSPVERCTIDRFWPEVWMLLTATALAAASLRVSPGAGMYWLWIRLNERTMAAFDWSTVPWITEPSP